MEACLIELSAGDGCLAGDFRQKRLRIFKSGQTCRHPPEQLRCQIFFQITASGEVSLSWILKSRNPAPRERVGCGISVKQVLVKEIRPKLPRQFFSCTHQAANHIRA